MIKIGIPTYLPTLDLHSTTDLFMRHARRLYISSPAPAPAPLSSLPTYLSTYLINQSIYIPSLPYYLTFDFVIAIYGGRGRGRG